VVGSLHVELCIKINKTEKSIVYNIFTFTVKHARAKSLGTKDNKRGMIQQTNDFRGRNYPDFPSNSGYVSLRHLASVVCSIDL
jgi:hypothetical protein